MRVDKPRAELRRVALNITIAPSQIYERPWLWPRKEGEQFTLPQLRALRELGMDAEAAEIVEVRKTASQAEYYWPSTEPAPVWVLECPVIGRVGERVKVIAPAGMAKLVYPDGSITKQRAPRRWGRR